MVVWAALAATFVASALALTPNITTEFFITSMSPMVKFEPPGSWIDTYSNFDDSLYEPGVIEAGYPMLFAPHGGRASISYVGTNVTWIAVMPVGADSTVVSPEVDGTAQPAPFMDTMIGGRRVVRWTSNPDIPMGPHTGSFGLTANAPPEAQVELNQSVSVLVNADANGTTPQETRCFCWLLNPLIATGASFNYFKATGPWRTTDTIGGYAGQQEIPYAMIVANQTSSIRFRLPPSTTLLAVNGTVGPVYGRYTVQLDPPLQVPVNATFNSYRRYTAVNQTMYLSALDPEVNYTVTITGDEDPTQFLGLTTLTACFLKNP